MLYTQDMERTNICGLSREELYKAGLPKPLISRGSVMLDARQSGAVQIIAHASDPSRVIAVFSNGMMWGTGEQAIGWLDMVADVEQTGMAYVERLGEVMG